MSVPSGHFILRISSALHARLRIRAQTEGRSLNSLCESLLEASTSDPLAGVWQPVVAELLSTFGDDLVAILLFGSRARGTAMDSSDTDLLLVFRPTVEITRQLYRKWENRPQSKSQAADDRLSLHCVSLTPAPEVGGFWLEIALDGVLLWERDSRTKVLLSELRKLIAEGHFVREKTHGHGYWKRKNG